MNCRPHYTTWNGSKSGGVGTPMAAVGSLVQVTNENVLPWVFSNINLDAKRSTSVKWNVRWMLLF